jgi:hypothetical protein
MMVIEKHYKNSDKWEEYRISEFEGTRKKIMGRGALI